MIKVEFINHLGETKIVEAESGHSLMEAAVKNGVRGIDADCGGACSCATCHCYIDEQWLSQTGCAEGDEEAMLEYAFEVKPNSRLSCQVKLNTEMDGIKIHLPAQQG